MQDTTHIFRASLKPKLYREIEIESRRSLYDLAESIVGAFAFDFDHAFGFYSRLTGRHTDLPIKYELFADLDDCNSDARSVKRTRVAEAFPTIGATLLFLFDYGDGWQLKVELIGLGEKAPRMRYPRLVATVGKAPPQYPNLDDE